MKPFLKSVAEYLLSNFSGRLHELVVVFPNKRARLFFNQYLSELTTSPVFAPEYYTISEYMEELSGKPIADQLTLLFELYRVYTDVTKSKELFDDFLFYCEMLLADFDDIDKYMVDAEMLFTNLTDLKEIENYIDYLNQTQIDAIKRFWETFNQNRESNEKEKFGNLWNVLFKIYSIFSESLDKQGIYYEGKAYRKAIEELENTSKAAPGQQVAFVGFNALSICERRLFRYLKKQGKSLFFWDFDNYYHKEVENHEADYFLDDFVKEFPPPVGFNFESKIIDPNKVIRIFNIPSTTGQAKALELALEKLPSEWKNNPVQTAIALADESLLMPVLNSLPENIAEVNISMGYPIKETQIFSLCRILLDLQKNKRFDQAGNESFYHNDVSRILQHGLLKPVYDNENIQLEEEITKSNMVYIKGQKLEQLPSPFNAIFQKGVLAANFTSFLIEILELIPVITNQVKSKNNLVEYEAAYRTITQLRRINDILVETKVQYSFKSLIRLVEKLLQGTTVPFTGEPLSGLQIMGILETRTLDFDNLIILSMNEGVFPKSGNVPSLIPYTLRKAFDLPTVEHQDAIFAYYFYRLLHRAKNVTLFFSSSVTDMKSGEPSRYIQQLIFEKRLNVKTETLGYKIYPSEKKNIKVQRTKESSNIIFSKYTGNNARTLSPSAINTYLNCNLRFYYRYIAQIPEPDSILEEIEANVFGSILHKSMEILYREFGEVAISSSDLQKLLKDKSKIQDAIYQAFWEEYLAPGQNYPGKNDIELIGKNLLIYEVIYKYIVNIINYDIKTAPFIIKGLEQKHFYNFEINHDKLVSVGGIIDRLDILNGKLRVIDYKTGKLKEGFNSIEDLFFENASKRNDAAFQAILYALILTKKGNTNITPGLYFVREITKANYSYKLKIGGRQKSIINDISEYIHVFEELLEATIHAMFSQEGYYNQTSDEKYCNFCPYKNICGKE